MAVGVLRGDYVAPDVFFNLFIIIMGAQITSDVRTRYTDRVKINQPFPNITTGECTFDRNVEPPEGSTCLESVRPINTLNHANFTVVYDWAVTADESGDNLRFFRPW